MSDHSVSVHTQPPECDLGMGICVSCGAAFAFNPDTVPSHDEGPICLFCVSVANPERIARGLPAIEVDDNAYEPAITASPHPATLAHLRERLEEFRLALELCDEIEPHAQRERCKEMNRKHIARLEARIADLEKVYAK